VTLQVTKEDAGRRLDQFLAGRMKEHSRAQIQQWIEAGRVRLDGAAAKASAKLRGGERVEVTPEERPALEAAYPEPIPLDILYEDDDLVVVNKPAGMTVHAGAGRREGTLVNALLHHFGRLSQVGGPLRPGIVHRLDRLTSGVLVAAKSDAAHRELARQFAAREVRKVYLALVHGRFRPAPGGWTRLEMPIRRDRRHRIKMTARAREGRAALTEFRVLEEASGYSLLEVRIGTGRTHQIRVHLAAIGHPVVGDTLYGAARQEALHRFFLHAREIAFRHPATGELVTVQAPLPPELGRFLSGIMKPNYPA
jgi:23S rRNA pseudouridine1911/1915/1917 synthase